MKHFKRSEKQTDHKEIIDEPNEELKKEEYVIQTLFTLEEIGYDVSEEVCYIHNTKDYPAAYRCGICKRPICTKCTRKYIDRKGRIRIVCKHCSWKLNLKSLLFICLSVFLIYLLTL